MELLGLIALIAFVVICLIPPAPPKPQVIQIQMEAPRRRALSGFVPWLCGIAGLLLLLALFRLTA